MPLQHDEPAPYGPPAAVIDLVEGYRERGFKPFTTDTLIRAGISDSLANRVLASLRLLDLVTADGEPTETLEGLRLARGEEEYNERRKEWLLSTYDSVLQFADPRRDPQPRVAEAFRGMKPDGQRPRMVTLMYGLFEWAGLIDSQPAQPGGSATRATTKRPKRAASRPASAAGAKSAGQPPRGEEPTDLPPALVGLLRQIPRVNGKWQWTKAERESFLAAFTAVLEFSVEEVEPEPLSLEPDSCEEDE